MNTSKALWDLTLTLTCFMIFLTLLCLSLSRLSASHPLPHFLPQSITNEDVSVLDPRSNPDLFTQRSLWNIVQSCLATIFACTWIAVHPNIPAPKDGEGRVVARRLAIMGYMLLAPEIVIMWTARQYLASSEISQRHRDKGWTKVHAFFLVMGGFMLYDKGKPLRTLESREFEELLEQGKIDWPSITEQEISDKSKGDYLSKAIVILQTGWFIAQCIARGVNRLAVTELEIVTLAFSLITMVIYSLWWHKPLDVKVPLPIHLNIDHIDPKIPPVTEHLSVPSDSPSLVPSVSTTTKVRPDSLHPAVDQPDASISAEAGLPSTQPQTNSYALLTASDQSASPHPSFHTLFQRYRERFWTYLHRQQQKHGIWRGTIYVLFIYPFIPFFGAFSDMVSCTTLDGKRFRVPTFYAPESKNDSMTMALGFILALAFGGIHCIAWSFYFPSLAERWIWRISAILVSGSPLLIVVLSLLANGDGEENKSQLAEIWDSLVAGICMFFACVYMVSRLSLLVLPLMELRALPLSAYVDLDWASLFPHI